MDTTGSDPQPPAGPAAGWYPDPYGQAPQRWWDGSQWTGQVGGTQSSGTGSDTALAQLAHILGLLFGFLAPLIIWLVKGKESAFIDQHAKEALNFQLTVLIAGFVGGVLLLVLVGFLVLLVVFVLDVVFSIQQTIKAGRGEPAAYPVSIRFIS
jgi:uncharacterized protein